MMYNQSVQKTMKTVFSHFYFNFTTILGISSCNVVPVDLLFLVGRLSRFKKLKIDLKFADEYFSFVLFLMRNFLGIFTKSEKRLIRH